MGTQWALWPIPHFYSYEVLYIQFLERLLFIIAERYEHYEMLITAVGVVV